MKYPCKQTVRSVARALEVQHVKFAARFEDAPRLTQHRHSLVSRKVMKHKSREDSVKGPVGIRKLICKSLIKLYLQPFASCLSLCSRQRFAIRI